MNGSLYKTLAFLPVKRNTKGEHVFISLFMPFGIIFEVGENENVDENKSLNHKIPKQE